MIVAGCLWTVWHDRPLCWAADRANYHSLFRPRRQSAARTFAETLWDCGGEAFYKRRDAIERFFGQLSAFGGGLAPLPAWVRRLERVERWITAKVIIYHARWLAKQAVA